MRPLLQFPHLPRAGGKNSYSPPLPPQFLHPTEFCMILYILFLWSGTPVCSQLVFPMQFCVWRYIPDISLERIVLHIHLLLHHLVLWILSKLCYQTGVNCIDSPSSSLYSKKWQYSWSTTSIRNNLISGVSVVLEDGSVLSGCPHKILHHVLLLGKAAIKLEALWEICLFCPLADHQVFFFLTQVLSQGIWKCTEFSTVVIKMDFFPIQQWSVSLLSEYLKTQSPSVSVTVASTCTTSVSNLLLMNIHIALMFWLL